MNSFYQALDQGYSPEEIIGFISKAIPQLSPQIKKATRAGYNIQQVLGFLAKNFDTESHKGMSESQIHAANRRADAKRTKYGLGVAATAVAAPIAASVASSALSRALPTSLKNAINSTSQTGLALNAAQQPQIPPSAATVGVTPQPQSQLGNQQTSSTSQPPVNAPSVAQTAQVPQAQGISTNIIKNSLAYKRQIDALINSGNGPEEIEAYLKKFQPSFIKTIEKNGGGSFKDVVSAYIQEKTRDEAMQPDGSGINAKEPQLQEEAGLPEEAKQPEAKIEKNATVIAPQGVGEVKEIRNGKAIVEVDGKRHQVDESELESSPIPEKDMGELLDALNKQIEVETGEEVSRAINLVGFSPETRSVIVVYNSGDIYPYDDLDDEDIEIATNLQGMRRTSGNNYIGPWVEGTKSPAGSKMHDFVKSLQAKRGKGKEYTAKYKPLYHGHGPAHEKLKEHRKKKKI